MICYNSFMTISDVMYKMILFSCGNVHDIDHFQKVFVYATTIAQKENATQEELEIIQISAIIHDIACPLCRKKYGNTNGKYQEKEGGILALDFLKDIDLPQKQKDRIVFLVSHHHTLTNVEGRDYQILLEADYIANATEACFSRQNIINTSQTLFKTKTGLSLLKSVCL